MRWKSLLWKRSLAVQCVALFCTIGLAADASSAIPTHAVRKTVRKTPTIQSASSQATAPSATASVFAHLLPLQISNINTRRRLTARLYDPSGHVDESVATQLDELLCDARDRKHWKSTRLDRRTLQLLYRAAYHFQTAEVEVVSAYRKAARRREGMHAQGRAVDFRLPGVDAAALAAYLRTVPRVGVGVYTHPRTLFVHLDVREHSYHWLDASPPRRHWRERNISSKALAALDAEYSPTFDWPEGLSAPGFGPQAQ